MANQKHVERVLAHRPNLDEKRKLELDWTTAATDLSKANFHGAKLANISLSWANCTEADFSNADLSNADLSYAHFGKANFSGANLSGATLFGAYFWGANFKQADLSGANLLYSILVKANLTEAQLYQTNLNQAHLIMANLQGAKLADTIFTGVTLKNAKGLDACNFSGSCPIDISTIRLSGRLSKIFLRGCGLPEDFIEYIPSLLSKPIRFFSCFISYSHADKKFARLLYDRLQARGVRCFLDEHQLLPGDDLHDGINRGIQLWDKVLLCASKSSLTSWWVDGEINRAFQKEAQLMKERGKKVLVLIPLNLDGYLLSDAYQSGMKPEITRRLAADFTGWKKDGKIFKTQFERVVKALRADTGAREKPPKSKL
jgi:uncharacterized protein YjbI with pentapeptide repeats